MIDSKSKSDTQVQTIYQLFYQYYQYYQIINYPEDIQKFYPDKLTEIIQEYYKKTNDNIKFLGQGFSNFFIAPINNYTILYNYYNKTIVTGPLAMHEYLMDIKKALTSNDPTFSVRNGPAIDIIVSSFNSFGLQTLE